MSIPDKVLRDWRDAHDPHQSRVTVNGGRAVTTRAAALQAARLRTSSAGAAARTVAANPVTKEPSANSINHCGVKLMQGEPVKPRIRLLPPSHLVVRDSTDIFLSDDALVSEAMRYIAANTRQALRVEQVVQAVGATTRTLHRRFEDTVGHSVKQQIDRARLQ